MAKCTKDYNASYTILYILNKTKLITLFRLICAQLKFSAEFRKFQYYKLEINSKKTAYLMHQIFSSKIRYFV